MTGAAPEVLLWPEAGDLRWWCPQATGTFSALPPELPLQAPAPAARALRERLPAGLVARLRSTPPCRLHLDPALAEPWHKLPWEGLGADSAPLLALRWSDPEPSPAVGGPPAVLSLWPPREPVQPFPHADDGDTRLLTGRAAVEGFLADSDLETLSALVVIAHGSEGGPAPLRDETGRDWRLPVERGLPPLVVLLACAGRDGNLLDEGRRLLAAGARAVVVPLGRLDATQAGEWLRGFLADWRAGLTVQDSLAAARGRNDQTHGAGRLCLLGQGALRLGAAPAPGLEDQLLMLTRRRWRAGWSAPKVLEELAAALGLGPDYPHGPAGRDLLEALAACQTRLPPLVRAWVLPLMAYLAEIHQHALLPVCLRDRPSLAAVLPEAPESRHHWAKLYYREGCYRQTLAELAPGLALDPDHARLLGLLANCLLDLNLPDPAQHVLERLETGLDRLPDAASRRLELLDRCARLGLRQGRPAAALGLYRRKRRQARMLGGDGRRELAGLVYAAAWCARGDEPAAAEALAAVREAGPVGRGNDDTAYLLRALAAWAWRRGDGEAAAAVARQGALLQERLAEQDPGPFAMALGFLRLCPPEYGKPWLEPAWEEARSLLECSHYWLELAALHQLAGEPAAGPCLERFQTRRREALFPGGGAAALPEGLAVDEARVAAREARERLLLPGPVPVETLVAAGLLPL